MTALEMACARRLGNPGAGAQTVLIPSALAGRRRGRALLLGLGLMAGLAAFAASPLRADEVSDLRQQLQQLKAQVNLLQNQLPGAGAAGGDSGGGTSAAQQVVQMQQFSQQMSQLQGQIEQLGIRVDDLTDKLTRLQKDTEFRLGRLEQGGAVGMGAPAMGAPAAGAPAAMAAPATGLVPLPQSAADASVDASAGAPQPLVGPEGSPAPAGAAMNSGSAALPPPAAPGTLGTLTPEQAANLPQAPAGAADAAAAAAAVETPAPAASQDPKNIVLPGNTPQEQYDYATGLLQRGAYAEAELALKAFVAQHGKDPLAGNAQYWLGESYYVRSDFRNAASAFAVGYQNYKSSPKAPDNLLKLGMSLGQSGQKDNACLAFKQLAKEFPNASAAIKDRSARAQQRYGCTGG